MKRLPPKWPFGWGQWLPPWNAPGLQETDWLRVCSLLV
jgi:hypothetical protein